MDEGGDSYIYFSARLIEEDNFYSLKLTEHCN